MFGAALGALLVGGAEDQGPRTMDRLPFPDRKGSDQTGFLRLSQRQKGMGGVIEELPTAARPGSRAQPDDMIEATKQSQILGGIVVCVMTLINDAERLRMVLLQTAPQRRLTRNDDS